MVQFYQCRSPRQLRRLPCCAPSAWRKSPQRTARAAILPGGRLAVTLTTWRPLPVVARVSCRQHTACAAHLGRQRRTTTCSLCVTVRVLTHSATPTRTLGPSPAPLQCLLLLDLRRLLPPQPSAALRSRQLNLASRRTAPATHPGRRQQLALRSMAPRVHWRPRSGHVRRLASSATSHALMGRSARHLGRRASTVPRTAHRGLAPVPSPSRCRCCCRPHCGPG